jgi:hypothetical protein
MDTDKTVFIRDKTVFIRVHLCAAVAGLFCFESGESRVAHAGLERSLDLGSRRFTL